MAERLEADVALIHIAGGDSRVTPPPGTVAQTAPRRAARGRAEDMLFLTVSVQTVRSIPAGLLDHLARLASEAYFGTPGTVTAALREAASAVNDHLLSANQGQAESMQFEGRLLAAVLREGDLYLAQCGPGQAVLIRPGALTRWSSDEATTRPLGLTV
ncbi:MAG TPA: PP2C family serine/threonine-protein phosphatase, partial [Anaerolineales bacterium]|nr:PP2C family serine/threonine-protein phosphatase [Anaerolineales bacterium]